MNISFVHAACEGVVWMEMEKDVTWDVLYPALEDTLKGMETLFIFNPALPAPALQSAPSDYFWMGKEKRKKPLMLLINVFPLDDPRDLVRRLL